MPNANVKELQKQITTRAAKDEAFRRELVADPKAVLSRELTKLDPSITVLPPNLKVQLVEEDSNTIYLMLPKVKTAASRELADEELAAVAGGASCASWQILSFTDCCTF
jgi:hypothetical protein